MGEQKEKHNKASIPVNSNFSIILTSREISKNNGKVSEAFKSRCTIIHIPNYENKNYLGKRISLRTLQKVELKMQT